MRISDWSSDVCSSDLLTNAGVGQIALANDPPLGIGMKVCIRLRKITFRQSYHRFACDFPQIRVGHVLAPLRAAGGLFLSGLPILCIIDNIVKKLDGFCA